MTSASGVAQRAVTHTRPRRRGDRHTPFAAVIVTALLCGACDAAADLATDVMNRTVPNGDGRPSLLSPVRSATSVRYEWDVETRMPPTEYARWVATSLRSQLDALAGEPPQLVFARYTGGDAVRLELALDTTPGGAHVHAVLTATPD